LEEVDLGVCRGRFFDGDGDGRTALVLPGAHYLPGFPLLWFAREALQQQGWNVLEVWDEVAGDEDGRAWVEARANAALVHTADAEERMIVAKSVSSFAAALPATRDLPAIWLTPLLNFDEIVTALRSRSGPNLLVGGTEDDPHWISQVARQLPRTEVLEIDGGDHGLQIPGEPLATLEALRRVVQSVGRFAARPG